MSPNRRNGRGLDVMITRHDGHVEVEASGGDNAVRHVGDGVPGNLSEGARNAVVERDNGATYHTSSLGKLPHIF